MENINDLILQNDERHETLKNIESNSESQLILSDEISENIKELNKNTELLLLQGDKPEKPEVQKVSLEGVSVVTLKGDKGETGEKGDEPNDIRLQELIIPLIPEPIKGDDGQDYILTEKDKKDIAKSIKVPVVEKVIEKIEVIIKEPSITNEIKEVAIHETAEEIANKLESLKDDARLDVKAIKGIDRLLEVFRGSLIPMISSGVKTLQGLFDINISNPSNGQALVYNTTTQKWGNGNVSGGSSTTLQTNGVNNTVQNLLNLKAGTNVTLADDGIGGVTINSTGGVTDGNKGDITVASAGANWTINANVVDNTKLSQMVTKTYKGRTSALTGNAEDVTVATLKADLLLTKTDVGLNLVDNTSDVNKPVSTATQTALNLKANLASPTFTGNVTVPTPSAGTDATNKTYVDSSISAATVGLLDDRGNYDASTNLYPATGGSGTAGAVLKGDLWTISVAGTLGGVPVTVGDVIRVLIDAPAQISTNWAIGENNFGYVAENSANKATTFGTINNTLFPSVQAVNTEMGTRDTANRARSNHTGTQLASTISDFASTVLSTVLTGLSVASSAVVAATDTILVAIGKLQAQNTAQDTVIASKVASVSAGTNTTVTGTATAPIVNAPTMTATVGGAVPTPPNNITTFLRGDGTFAAPAGGGDMVLANAQTNTGVKTFLDATLGLRNVANTFTSFFTNTNTASITYTLKDASGTIAFVSDITGTNSGTNTGDQTITLTGEATGSGTGSFAVTLLNSAVIGKVLTGISFAVSTAVVAADSILVAIGKLQAQNTAQDTTITGKTNNTTTISTTAPLSGGGDLSANRTLTTSMATNRLIGRGTAATGVMEEITPGAGIALSGTTLNVTHVANAQIGIAYTYVTGDREKYITHSNALAIAGTLPQAGATFPDGWTVYVHNIGAGALTITPTTSTINGNLTLVLTTGQSAMIVSNGTNYQAFLGASSGGGTGDMVLANSQTNSGVKTFLDATLGLRNVANTITSFFTNAATVARTYTLKDASGTIAFTSDITGTNSGTNTGDQTSIVGITGTTAQFNTALSDNDFATLAGTETITNKRNTKRTVVTAQAAAPAINTDNTDVATITGLAQAITSMTTNLTGTPNPDDYLIINITDNGTARAITWGASFASGGATLPTTTVISIILKVGFIRVGSIWNCYAVSNSDAFDLKANLISPTFTGIPLAPTAAAGTNTTQLATTAFTTAINNNASYRNILQANASHIAARVAGTYALASGNAAAITGVGTLYPIASIHIVGADYPTINGITTKLRIRTQLYTNDVAPTGNYTFGLYPITRPATSGGAGLNIFALGAVVAGSNGATYTAPAADLLGGAVGADFVIPADGHYAIGLVTTATVATSSHVHLHAQLQVRNA